MYAQYGSYVHPANSVTLANVTYRPVHSPRGMRYATKYIYNIIGELYPDPALTTKASRQADITSKVLALENAYSQDFQDFGFYEDGGALTQHYLNNSHDDNMTGNIIDYLSYPDGNNAEYAGKRTFAAGISALFRDTRLDIFEYSNSIIKIGKGGPIYEWKNRVVGDPYYVQHSQKSYVQYVHSGYAIKILPNYFVPPPPLASEPNYLPHLTKIKYTQPRKYKPGKYMLYRTDWEYHYTFPTEMTLFPILP